MSDENLLTLTADIVSAHLSHNSVPTGDLPGLIETVYASLDALGQPQPEEEKLEPAVSIRSSIRADAITCLECGIRLKMLKRHLFTHHQLSPAEYKVRWGLSPDYPLVASDYAARRSDLAREIGLGRKPDAKPRPAGRSRSIAQAVATLPGAEDDGGETGKPGRKPRTRVPAPTAA